MAAGVVPVVGDGQGVTVAIAEGGTTIAGLVSTKPMPATNNKPSDESNILKKE